MDGPSSTHANAGAMTAHPLPPGSTIGIFGGGQLGRMLAVAAARLGLKVRVYSDRPGPACDVAAATTIAPFEDLAAVEAFAGSVDVLTYEFENVPLEAATAAERVRLVYPGPRALGIAQDRLAEKRFIAGLDIPVAPFAAVDNEGDLEAALATLGKPAILKTRRFGYDGKGQVRLIDTEVASALDAIGRVPALLESQVTFAFEISVLAVRAKGGETLCYDIPVNTHRGGILDTSVVPAPLPRAHSDRAKAIASRIAVALDYVGVLAVEMFYLGERAPEPLIVNEIAPRVHNSGHWTIDACTVSQFENHIRAVAGWPLGSVRRHSNARMKNLIGEEVEAWEEFAREPGACLHIYGKDRAQPGRKMGHVTRLEPLSEGEPGAGR